MPPRSLAELQSDANFRALSPEAQQLVVQQIAPEDAAFNALSPEAQQIVVSQLTRPQMPSREQIMREQGEIRAAPSAPIAFGQRVLQESGLPASAQAVAQLPEQSFLRRLLLPLGAINVPFQAVGELAQMGAEKLGARPPDPTNVLSQLLSPRTLATLGTSFAVPAGIRAVQEAPEFAAQAVRSMFPGIGPIGKVPFPAAPLAMQAKRAYEEQPQMVRTVPLPPPAPPGAPGQGTPLLQPGVAPTQLEVAGVRAGMRGPGLLSATEQPLITSAPARVERGTSEIVDEFGRKITTRPPQHIEPQDAILPPTRGPVGFGERPPGELTSAATLAAERAGVKPVQPAGKAPAISAEQTSQWNDIIRQGGFVLPPLAAKLGGAAIGGATGAAGGAQLGETTEEKIALGLAGGAVGAAAGAAAPGVLSRWNARVGKQIAWLDRADVDVFTAGPLLKRAEALKVEQRMPGPRYAGVRLPLAPSAMSNIVSAINKTLQAHNITLPRNIGGPRGAVPVHAPLTLRLIQGLESDPRVITTLSANVKAQGGSMMDVAQLLVDSAQSPSQLLRRAEGLSRVLEEASLTDRNAANLLWSIMQERPFLEAWDVAGHFARRADNVWRGLLVAAWRTALRNMQLQQARVIGVEALEHMISGAMLKASGSALPAEKGLTPGARYAWEYAVGWASPKARREINDVLDAFPAFHDKLLQLYSSDVAVRLHPLGGGLARGGRFSAMPGELQPMGPIASGIDRAFNLADKGVKGVNALNRFQEVMTRKAAMRAALLDLLEKRGIHNLDQIPVEQIPPEDIARAVTHALRMTFAESPSLKAPGVMERLFARVLSGTGKSGAAAVGLHAIVGVPFVRYLFNAGRFIAEHPYTSTVPAMRTFWRLATPTGRAAITRGDAEATAKFVTGATALLGAWQFVNSEYAGDGVLEAKTPFGNVNLSVLGPLIPAYVLPARLVKSIQDGTLKEQWPEFVRAATELRNRMEGVTLGVDNLIQSIPTWGDEPPPELLSPSTAGTRLERRAEELDRPTRGLRRMAGETLAGSMQFVTSLQRLFATYGPYIPQLENAAREENIKRDTRSAPFTAPLQARVPVVARQLGLPTAADLPPQTSALRSGTIPIETPLRAPAGLPLIGGAPLPADIIGLQAAPQRTPGELEALKLGMKPREIQGQPTGFPGADRLLRGETGLLADPTMRAAVKSEGYQRLSKEAKAVVVDILMEELRGAARQGIQERVARKLQGGEALSPEERETIDVVIRGALDPRMRELLRRRGFRQIPR